MRIFEDAEVTHVDGSIDPLRDIEVIIEELILKDLELIAKTKERLERELHHKKDKKKQQELETVVKCEQVLNERKQIRFVEWKSTDLETLNSLQLLTAKPVVYLINMSPNDYINKKNKWLGKIKQWVDAHGGEPIVPFSGVIEADLLNKDDAQRKAFLEENKITSAIPKVINAGYHSLELIHFFTCGTDEVRAWTVRNGSKAPQAAGVIHTDFEKGFVCAEVMKFTDYKELGSEGAVKAAGKYKQEGKNYVVVDGDIMFFKANTVGLDKKK
jgi:obg-like ATPase 1